MESKDIEIINCMEKFGGSFVKALAECLHRADPFNYQKLKQAFPEYFLQYAQFFKKEKEQK